MTRLPGSEVLKLQNGAGPVFGAGSNQPSFEKNWQKIEWKLASGERVLLETSIFQLNGQNPYALVGGPRMPLCRVVEIKKKGFWGWKDVYKWNEYDGGFEVLNTLIRSTDEFREREKAGEEANLLIKKQSYQHVRFGVHEYYNVADETQAGALSNFVLSCASLEDLRKRMRDAIDDPDLAKILNGRVGELRLELEEMKKRLLSSQPQ